MLYIMVTNKITGNRQTVFSGHVGERAFITVDPDTYSYEVHADGDELDRCENMLNVKSYNRLAEFYGDMATFIAANW